MKEKNELPMGSAEQSEIDAKLDRILSECGLAYPFSADLMMNLPTLLEELNSRLAFCLSWSSLA